MESPKVTDIKSQKLLYHLTKLKNMGSILSNGLLPRSQISGFEDVADQEIIRGRSSFGLQNFVPFHWFSRNPFDGRVQEDHPKEKFVLISVRRTFAETRGWKVITRHPLANGPIEICEYSEGFSKIDWNLMNKRDYQDQECKCVCMAECLSPNPVQPNSFFKIFVKSQEDQNEIIKLSRQHGAAVETQVNCKMFS